MSAELPHLRPVSKDLGSNRAPHDISFCHGLEKAQSEKDSQLSPDHIVSSSLPAGLTSQGLHRDLSAGRQL